MAKHQPVYMELPEDDPDMGNVFVVCTRCGALVARWMQEKHTEGHLHQMLGGF